MKKKITDVLEFIGGIGIGFIYYLPYIYMAVQLLLVCITIPKDFALPHCLIADGFFRFIYTFVAILLWYICYKRDYVVFNYIIGLFMFATFCSPKLFDNTVEACFALAFIGIGLCVFCGFANVDISPEVSAKRKEENEKRWQKEKQDYEELKRRTTPKWVFEYAIDRGGYVEYVKFDENNPITGRIKSAFRGKLISYSNLTVTVEDGNQTFIYYADGRRIGRPSRGH